MPDPSKERADLAKADEDIVAGEKRLADQAALIQELANRGESTEEAEELLQNYQAILKTFREHRQLIIDTLKR